MYLKMLSAKQLYRPVLKRVVSVIAEFAERYCECVGGHDPW